MKIFFSDVAKALWLTPDLTFSWKERGSLTFVTPAPVITAPGTKWPLRELTESMRVGRHNPQRPSGIC